MGRLHITAARHPPLPSESGARQHRLDQQAPASIDDVQRSCKGWPAGSLWREALSSKLRSSLVRERSSVSSGRLCPSSAPPFWRQHFRCTCGAAPWRKASSSITCCTSQRSFFKSTRWPATNGLCISEWKVKNGPRRTRRSRRNSGICNRSFSGVSYQDAVFCGFRRARCVRRGWPLACSQRASRRRSLR